ncbi:ankyrin repeat domain-containing protein 9-like [Tachysurus fulvidraco]|uniref:ankyrin repeat domain-containing protein 9-like n=1 Tax=Tachysurus fulvidraco TaxID=1234273 RepID=UPI001FEE3374|nr:ankyrin repeat domain-containing protein 9-like [Tachysurus fulvidraco]
MGGTCDEHKILTLYQAVKQHEPVQMLEDMRNMEIFHWEECSHQRTYTPSEALMYAIVHDHRDYAQYLLNEFSDGALATPGEHACCSHSSAPHLALAVHYNRKEIMALILQKTSWSNMNRGECKHVDEGRTPLHLACELLHSDAVILLLASGASPQVKNKDGMTPLDLILEQQLASKWNTRAKMLCLERMLMFMTEVRFKMKSSLKNDPEYWSNVLGEETFNYLNGRIPRTLFLLAMKRTLTQLPLREFFKSLDELPIPAFLKPLPQSP